MSQEPKAKRYFLNEALDENVEHSEQGYVLYADYAQLERTNAALLGALKLALVTIDAFWPNDPPENQTQVDEDRAIAKVRKLARAAIAEAKKENN